MNIILLEPEIPQNTGNIARLASATGSELWLVGRLGFSLTDKYTKRAGMDYWDKVSIKRIPTLEEYYSMIGADTVFISTKGTKLYTDIPQNISNVVFGCEGSGLPQYIYNTYPDKLYRIPMLDGIRSINLASSAAIVVYSLIAKNNFSGMR